MLCYVLTTYVRMYLYSWLISGLCLKTNFDVRYTWTGERSQFGNSAKYLFRGSSKSFIYFDEITQLWTIKLYSTDESYAVCKYCSLKQYPLGVNEWEIHNDICGNDTDTVILSFSTCNTVDEYNCWDGTWYIIVFLKLIFIKTISFFPY